MAANGIANREKDYSALVQDLKRRIKSERLTAAVAVNRELIQLYWGIGRDILQRQQAEGCGAGVIARLVRCVQSPGSAVLCRGVASMTWKIVASYEVEPWLATNAI